MSRNSVLTPARYWGAVTHIAIFASLFFGPERSALAAVQPHALIAEGMVLQQGKPVSIWGAATENEKVTVLFQGQEASTNTKNGRWRIRLANLKSGGPFPMTIAGDNTIRLKNVYVGEVWVCSGQSNMWWPVSMSGVSPEVIAQSKNARIRIFSVPFRPADTPQQDLE